MGGTVTAAGGSLGGGGGAAITTGGSPDGGQAGNSAVDGSGENAEGSCSCSVPGMPRRSGWLLLLPSLGFIAARRRRRST